MPESTTLTRRAVLAGACVACAATATGCATYGPPAPPAPAPAPAPAPGGGPAALAQTADVPVGGGLIVGDTVITQPTDGEFKAFSSVCTHAGCAVNEVVDGTINCPCHGSRFSVEDGSPTAGPANGPLQEKQVTVDGTAITLA
jgi:Rieske Fe-S protein